MTEIEESIARAEDKPRTLIFVDILGFAAITNTYRVRVQDWRDDVSGFSGSSTTEMPNRINRFSRVLDQCAFDAMLSGGVQAMLFSDCAFLVVDNSIRAAVMAVDLMRKFILNGVPVRMGLGKGTFYNIEHSTSTNVGNMTVNKSRFIGTAVVRAHAAEQCNGKGMRVFLHSSLDEDIPTIQRRVKTVAISNRLKRVKWELDFLYEQRPSREERKVEAKDRELFDKVARMQNPEWPKRIRLHYSETLHAMNRMRQANSRKLVDLNILEYGEKC
jgi:hypothetical protein